MQDVRYVVIHTPGPRWQVGRPIFEQEGVHAHIEHYRRLLQDGRLELGGPFLDIDGGGMMIPAAGLGEQEITEFANADPSVASGLLRAEVRPWMIGMQKDSAGSARATRP
ncbi:MAG: hypothetical protein JSR59_23375 [Proteobacteria bacterium]|nr:hypothetical protein [Pseudomonadota bacterium]